MSLKKAVECIRRNKRFLITSHTNVEGDALGSELSFYRLLKKLGKVAAIINEEAVPLEYAYLPGLDTVNKLKQNSREIKFDCFTVLDCSDLRRTANVYKLNKDRKTVLNIDHHVSNEKFGDVNWVEPKASSCCEMIYKLYKRMRVPFDKEIATLLYVGMLTDTGSFRFSNTSGFTHRSTAELLKYNLDVRKLYKHAYENVPFRDMRLLSKILPHVKRQAHGKIVWVELKRSLLENRKFTFDLSEHILSYERAIKDVEVAVLFKENLGARKEIRVNFRSQGSVDVNKVARFFGGGGHRTASGATIKGTLLEVRNKVLRKIRESLK